VSTRYPLRPHDFAFFAALASLVLFLFAVARGSAAWALAWAALTVATSMPFDVKRMAYGGFEVLVDL
jgi:hypothetical protein